MSTKKLQILGSFGNEIYTQNDEPVDAPDGSLWVDLDEDSVGFDGIVQSVNGQTGLVVLTAEDIGALASSNWSNMKVGVIGDSQSERNSHKTDAWWKYVTTLGMAGNLQAVSGYTIANNTNSLGCFLDLAKKLSYALDIVFVMGGVNDVWFNTPMGEFGSSDNTTFYGAMKELCEFLIEKYSSKTIVFITPTEQNNQNCTNANTTGLTATDFSIAIKKVCAKYAIPVFDANAVSGIYPFNAKNASAYTTDNLHLNDAGHERLGKQIVSFMQTSCYVPEAGIYFPELIGTTKHAYYSNNSLYLSRSSIYGGVALPNVIKMSIDMSFYSLPAISGLGKPFGWLGLKQADGSYKAVSIYNGWHDYANEGLENLRGEKWDFDPTLTTPTNQEQLLWPAPASQPKIVDVILENQIAKIYFDDVEVYSTPCVELGYINSAVFGELVGLTLTYANETK